MRLEIYKRRGYLCGPPVFVLCPLKKKERYAPYNRVSPEFCAKCENWGGLQFGGYAICNHKEAKNEGKGMLYFHKWDGCSV